MANGIDVKMGVSGVSQFKSAMNQSSQSVKTLDAALKLNEKQLQATGDKETYMAQKSKLLQQQIAAQSNVVKQGQQALQAMEKNGVDPASAAYQKLQQQVLNAQTALLSMQTDLGAVGQTATETAQQTDKLTNSLNGINKKVSFDAVLNGIGKITDGMEAAARKVASLANDVWSTMTAAAAWGDNENTLAAMYGIDVETLQRMQGASRIIDTSVEAIIKSQQKLKQSIVSDPDAFKELGVQIEEIIGQGKYGNITKTRELADIFWDLGDALLNYEDEIGRDVYAQHHFGRSWMELMPLFQAGRQKYQEIMDAQSIVTEENVNKLNDLDDALQKLDQDYQATKNTILSELAPAFKPVADAVSGLLQQFNDYLKRDEGKEKLEGLSAAVTSLFSGLSDVDFGNALDTAKGILDSITGALKWISDHHGDVEAAIKGIGIAFLSLKAAEVIGTLAQGALALKNLFGGGAAAGAAAASSVSGNAVAGAAAAIGTGSTLLDFLSIGVLAKIAYENDYAQRRKFEEKKAGAKKAVIDPETGEIVPEDEYYAAHPEAAIAARRANHGGIGGRIDVGEIYDQLYEEIQSYNPAASGALSPIDFWKSVLDPLVRDAAGISGVADEEAGKISYMLFEKLYDQLFDPEWEGSTGGILNLVQEAIDEAAAANPPSLPGIEPELAADADAVLQAQLNSMTLSVPTYPNLSSVDGEHANGLPFVPFDGYIAALHRGERVVPASLNKSYTNTSNVFFDHVNVNNGVDADGLAAKIAEQTRHAMAGFGG